MSASQDQSAGEQLLRAAVEFLLEGADVYPARLLLQCSIVVRHRTESYRNPKPHRATYVDVALDGPRGVYDALETRANLIGQAIRRSFSATIEQGERLVTLSARLSSHPINGSEWRTALWARADDVESRARGALDGGDTITQQPSDMEQAAYTGEQPVAPTDPDPRKVFVVHGRDVGMRDEMFAFLRSIGLQPLEWAQAVAATRIASPYVGQILDAAFSTARAVVVLLTPDDEARLREPYWGDDDPAYEKELTPQARPNVLFEAGMALGRQPERTVLVELGTLRPFSDVAGRHVVRMGGSPQRRQELAQRLITAGCTVDTSGTSWLTAGNFSTVTHSPALPSTPAGHRSDGDGTARAVLPPMPRQAPMLVPDGAPTFSDQNPNWLKWEEPSQDLTIVNHGPSPAFNVAGVLYGCADYIIQGHRDTSSRNEHWSCWLGNPISAKSSLSVSLKIGNGIFYDENKTIGGYAFNAPPEPSQSELMQGKGVFRVARVVLTYHDASGQKYASIFDYVPHREGWERVAALPVDKDLSDLQG